MIRICDRRTCNLTAAAILGGLTLVCADRPTFGAGDDHGPAQQAIVVSPRAEVRIGTQELVITYMDRKLTVFLQRYVDGVPTTGAEIEVTADFIPGTLEEVAPGIYSGSDWTLAGGRNEIEISMTVGGRAETATVPLVIPSSTLSPSQSGAALTVAAARTIPPAVLAAAAVVTYLLVSLLFWRRRSRSEGQPG